MSMTTTTALPVELIMEILSYLPAKSLLNSCKLVCKAWRIVVKDPDFVKMHLNRGAINGGGTSSSSNSNNNNNNNYESLICTSGKGLFQLYPPFNFGDVPMPNSGDVTITQTKLDVESFPFDYSRWSLVGSCNGLLCIYSKESIILLNPCTRRYKLSPSEFVCLPISYGFGCFYDSTTTIVEYKVVRIAHNLSKHEVKVYSMSTNSWRTVKDIITNDIHEMITKTISYRSGVFLNGALHWMREVTSDLVSFDMRSEEFRIMSRPPYDGNKNIKVLVIMRGCLCMIHIRDSWNLEISIMKEYGVSESWTREFVIRLSTSLEVSSGLRSIVCVGDQILINKVCGRLVLYDMNKKMSLYIQGNGVPDVYVMVPCIESLVSLKSPVLPLSKDRKRRMECLNTEISSEGNLVECDKFKNSNTEHEGKPSLTPWVIEFDVELEVAS